MKRLIYLPHLRDKTYVNYRAWRDTDWVMHLGLIRMGAEERNKRVWFNPYK